MEDMQDEADEDDVLEFETDGSESVLRTAICMPDCVGLGTGGAAWSELQEYPAHCLGYMNSA
eukprot:2688429-Lingulodinium_polyedra.AAC.1